MKSIAWYLGDCCYFCFVLLFLVYTLFLDRMFGVLRTALFVVILGSWSYMWGIYLTCLRANRGGKMFYEYTRQALIRLIVGA